MTVEAFLDLPEQHQQFYKRAAAERFNALGGFWSE